MANKKTPNHLPNRYSSGMNKTTNHGAAAMQTQHTPTTEPDNRTPELTYDEMPVTGFPTGAVFVKRQSNYVLLQAAQRAAGVTVDFPTNTKNAFLLLQLMGYDADRKVLDYVLARGYMESPPKANRKFQWNREHIVAFADALEGMRRWLFHPAHVHKFNERELAHHHNENLVMGAAVGAFRDMTLADCLGLLVDCNEPKVRGLLVAVVKEKIGLIHVKGNEPPPEHRTDTN